MLVRDVFYTSRTDLEAEGQLVDPRGESSDLSVGQNARVIRVDLVKHLGDVELLLSAHQEVEVGEGELHVLRVTHAVSRRLVKLLWESEGKSPDEFKMLPLQGKLKLRKGTSLTCPASPA